MQEMSGHPEGYSHTVGMGKKHLIKCKMTSIKSCPWAGSNSAWTQAGT